MNLLKPFDLSTFASLLASAPPGAVADWLVGDVQAEPVDACLLYARDAAAYEGFPGQVSACPRCGTGAIGKPIDHPLTPDTQVSCCLNKCPWKGLFRDTLLHPDALLPVEFPQAHFAAWAGQVYGEAIGRCCDYLYLDAIEEASQWHVRHRGGPIPRSICRSRSAAVRDLKRHTLRLLPGGNCYGTKVVQGRTEDFVPSEPTHGGMRMPEGQWQAIVDALGDGSYANLTAEMTYFNEQLFQQIVRRFSAPKIVMEAK